MMWQCVKAIRNIPQGALVEIEFHNSRFINVQMVYVTYNGKTTIFRQDVFLEHFKETL